MFSFLLSSFTGHPYEPLLAASGIDNTIKIFSPDARARAAAKSGLNIGSQPSDLEAQAEEAHYRGSGDPERALSSKKCLDDSYRIMSQNDVRRQGGMRDAYVTVGPSVLFTTLERTPISFADWVAWMDG